MELSNPLPHENFASQSPADCMEGIRTSAAPARQKLSRCMEPYPAAQKANPAAAAAAPDDEEEMSAEHAGSDVSEENQSEDDTANDSQLPRVVTVTGLSADLNLAERHCELHGMFLHCGVAAILRIRQDSATVIFHSGESAARAVESLSQSQLLLRYPKLHATLCSSSHFSTPPQQRKRRFMQKSEQSLPPISQPCPAADTIVESEPKLPPISQPRPAADAIVDSDSDSEPSLPQTTAAYSVVDKVPSLPPIQQSPIVGCGHNAIPQPTATRSGRRQQQQRGVAVMGIPSNFRAAELRRELRTVFQPFGRIVRIDTPRFQNYAFVIFETGESAGQAAGCFDGRPLVLGGYGLTVKLRHRPNTP